MSSSRSGLWTIGRLVALSATVALLAWVIGYAYVVKITGYPAAGFLTFKVAIGLLVISFALCLIFRLGGFFKGRSR